VGVVGGVAAVTAPVCAVIMASTHIVAFVTTHPVFMVFDIDPAGTVLHISHSYSFEYKNTVVPAGPVILYRHP
jgi:hypothetical protein